MFGRGPRAGVAPQVEGAARDGRGLVAHALEVMRDFHRDGDEAELGGERRLGEEVEGHVVDLDFELIEDVVILLDLAGEGVVALDERTDGAADRGLRVAGHREEALLQLGEFFVVMGHGDQPKRPET